MLTLRGISSTVFTVRLDTKCCNVMFAATGHNFRYVVRRSLPMVSQPFQVVRGCLPAQGGHIAGARPGARLAAARRRWLTPLGGG